MRYRTQSHGRGRWDVERSGLGGYSETRLGPTDLREIEAADPDGPSTVGTYDHQSVAGSPTVRRRSSLDERHGRGPVLIP
jgi:hypothetical protein